jgi:hypothetical protein
VDSRNVSIDVDKQKIVHKKDGRLHKDTARTNSAPAVKAVDLEAVRRLGSKYPALVRQCRQSRRLCMRPASIAVRGNLLIINLNAVRRTK